MLAKIRKETKDKIVIVSNYTQTLDLIQNFCQQKQYVFVTNDDHQRDLKDGIYLDMAHYDWMVQ